MGKLIALALCARFPSTSTLDFCSVVVWMEGILSDLLTGMSYLQRPLAVTGLSCSQHELLFVIWPPQLLLPSFRFTFPCSDTIASLSTQLSTTSRPPRIQLSHSRYHRHHSNRPRIRTPREHPEHNHPPRQAFHSSSK